MEMPMTSNVNVVFVSLWNGMNLSSLNAKYFSLTSTNALSKYMATYGSAFALILIPAMIAFTGVVYLATRTIGQSSNETVKKVVAYVQKTVVFRFVIRAVLATFVQLCMMAFTGFYKHKVTEAEFVGIHGAVQALSCLVAILCFGAYIFATKTTKEMLEGSFVQSYFGVIVDGIKTNAGSDKAAYTSVFLARRAFFVLALLQQNFVIRFCACVALSMMYITYILIAKPHANRFSHYLEIFNEAFFLLAIYALPMFNKGFITNKVVAFDMGWVFNVLVLVPLFGANFVHTFFFGVRQAFAQVKRTCAKKEKVEIAESDDNCNAIHDEIELEKMEKIHAIEAQDKMNKQDMDVIQELPMEEVDNDFEKECFLQDMQKRGLGLKNIEKDGNCVFRAIGLLLFEDQAKHMQVRHDIVNQLVDQREKYEKNISYSKGGIETFDAYTQNMRLDSVWGDHIELQAAADLYGVDINVYTIGTGVERPNMIVECNGEIEYLPISLWYEDESHYHAFKDSSAEPASALVEGQEASAANAGVDLFLGEM
jgi:hypothetical protein